MVDRLVNSEANTRRIAMVENCFGSSGIQLAIPGRVLVGEGVLTKMCRKRPKPRQFFLFNDILVYGNIVIGKKKYNKQHVMPLEEVSLEPIDDAQHPNGWLIRTTTKSFVVCAATATEKQEWMAHINKCVEDLLRKSGKKPVENHAAVWVPDAQANVCMRCKRTQFTIIVRRHHCRNCGEVVCGPCSAKKFLLPQQSSKPLRVCTTCYDSLNNAAATMPTESSKAQLNYQQAAGRGSGGGGGGVGGGNGIGGSNNATKLNDNSSADDDSDDENNGTGNDTTHDEPKFYGDKLFSITNSNVTVKASNDDDAATADSATATPAIAAK